MRAWEEIQEDLKWDGMWRDIYVQEIGAAEWRKLLRALPLWNYELAYSDPTGSAELPGDFPGAEDWACHLTVKVGAITLNCHFFLIEEIEFDFDPREVKVQNDWLILYEFLKRLGRLLDRPVIVTYENTPKAVIAEWWPGQA
ncbi:MAG: hypothetical protein AAF495_25775 [Pseudomonadota bacterium]